jgi:hypothetical protein
MKIAKVEALRCDGGWRPWTFVRMETDGGLVAWGGVWEVMSRGRGHEWGARRRRALVLPILLSTIISF